jgi:Spy/CpxP family protein refolding chaperone
MRRILFAFAALLMATGALAQQLPPGKWWRRPEIVQTLNLSDEQQDRLEAIFRASATELIDLKAEVEKATIALRGELDRPQLDRVAIHRIASRLSEARGRLFDRELTMFVEMRGVLTEQQWNRMRNQLDKLERPMPRPRPRQ